MVTLQTLIVILSAHMHKARTQSAIRSQVSRLQALDFHLTSS